MKILSLFNNKGGVGKTTLTYHLAHILAEPIESGGCGKKVLLMDLDPQSNLTIYAEDEQKIAEIWEGEDSFIDKEGFEKAKEKLSTEEFQNLLNHPRTVHFLLKPTEDGVSDETILPPPISLNGHDTLHMIPGRLSLYKYESVIAQRWSASYLGAPLSLRTITKIRNIALDYTKEYHYDYVIMDTSPSLGALNKVIISLADGFIIPALPDLFSSYGIRNIGESITFWKKEFMTMKSLLTEDQTKDFPEDFVNFLGYTIFNAKKYESKKDTQQSNKWNLTQAHNHYASQFPEIIKKYILTDKLSPEIIENPIGETAVMYGHNTFPSQAQKYKKPMWELPNVDTETLKENKDFDTINGNRKLYFELKEKYKFFADDLLKRVEYLEIPKQEAVSL